jgi:WD40 repeat protein
VLNQLQKEGVACVTVDFQAVGTSITEDNLYFGIVSRIARALRLDRKLNLKVWWNEHQLLSSVQRFSTFLEAELLPRISQSIVIFFDEIDLTRSFPFNADDFFAALRECYNHRADDPDFKRLTFAFFGVATPSDLVQNKQITPFNIGQPIDLTGFQLAEVQPLTPGIASKSDNPQALLQAVLTWTGGQPYLTQRVCRLIATTEGAPEAGQEAIWVEQLVQTQIIENWEAQDTHDHLKYIRDRMTEDGEKYVGQLLGLYQKAREPGGLTAEDSPDQMLLRLTGLVVKRGGKLQVYNRIYEQVFNGTWLQNALDQLRPYAESFNAWKESKYKDESQLLQGKSLQNARNWAEDKSLTDKDRRFLDASLDLEKILENKTRKILEVDKRKAENLIRLGITILGITLLIAAVSFITLSIASNQSQSATKFEQQGTFALQEFEFEPIKALISAIDSGKELQKLEDSPFHLLSWYRAASPKLALQRIVDNINELNEIRTYQKGVNSVSFIKNDTQLVTAGEDGTVRLWNAYSGKRIKNILNISNKTSINSVRFSKNNRFFLTANEDGRVAHWSEKVFEDSSSKPSKPLIQFLAHKGGIQNVRFSSDEDFFLTSGKEDGYLKVWSLNGTLISSQEAHINGIRSLNFSLIDSHKLVTGGKDGNAKLWSLDGNGKLKLLQVFQHNSKNGIELNCENSRIIDDRCNVNSVNFSNSKNEQKIASAGSDGIVRIWNLNGQLLQSFAFHVGKIELVRFSPDDSQMVTSSSDDLTSNNDSTVRIWSFKTGKLLSELNGHQGSVESARYDKGGKKLVTSGKEDGTIRIWKVPQTPKNKNIRHDGKVNSTRFNSDGKVIATAGDDGTIRLWNFDEESLEPKQIYMFDQYRNKIKFKTLRFYPKDDCSISQRSKCILAAGASDGHIRLLKWDGKTIKELKKFQEKHDGSIESISFNFEGNQLASGSDDQTVKLWSIDNQFEEKLLYTFADHKTRIWSVRFSPDDRRLGAGGELGKVVIWTLKDRKPLILNACENPGQNCGGTLYAIGFSPDNQYLVTVGDDSIIQQWDFFGKRLKKINIFQGSVRNITFASESTKEQLLATAGSAGTVRLWNWSGQLLADFKGHHGIVRSFGFGQQGKFLVSAGDDGVPRIWRIQDLSQLLEKGCNRLEEYRKNHPEDLKAQICESRSRDE